LAFGTAALLIVTRLWVGPREAELREDEQKSRQRPRFTRTPDFSRIAERDGDRRSGAAANSIGELTKKRTRRRQFARRLLFIFPAVIASEAKQSRGGPAALDCFGGCAASQ
jgi:hypothetical protein